MDTDPYNYPPEFADLRVQIRQNPPWAPPGKSRTLVGVPHISRNTQADDAGDRLMKLMIVEDNPHMSQLLKQLLSDLAEAIVECGDGEQAVAAYAIEQPDWTLMDLQMHRMGGIEATRRIRADWPEARILVVTEYDDPHWRAAARQAGACGYLLKDDLLEVRRRLLAQE